MSPGLDNIRPYQGLTKPWVVVLVLVVLVLVVLALEILM